MNLKKKENKCKNFLVTFVIGLILFSFVGEKYSGRSLLLGTSDFSEVKENIVINIFSSLILTVAIFAYKQYFIDKDIKDE